MMTICPATVGGATMDKTKIDNLKKEFDWYLAHQLELVEKHYGKYLVIKGQQVIGVYDGQLEAVQETSKDHELGTFLVQKCEPGSDSHTVVFHSRVAIQPYITDPGFSETVPNRYYNQ
jgi:hypothetical protein